MNFLPFGYLWLIKKNLEDGKKIKTILDLGCGKGDFALNFNQNKTYEITGLDVYKPYLEICRKTKMYKKLVKGDITKKLKFKDKSFDGVICLQVIEHLKRKEGERLLSEINRVSKKMIIISTPVGECSQEAYDENKYQEHHSFWQPQQFRKLGFRVFGVGLKLAYGSHSHAQEKLNLLKLPLYFLSFILNPVTNKYAEIGAQMVAVKKK